MPRGATCLSISKATTIGSGGTPRSATSPPNRQRQNPRNPVSTSLGEGQGGGEWSSSASQQCERGPCQRRDDQVVPRHIGAGLALIRSRPLAPGSGAPRSLGIVEA